MEADSVVIRFLEIMAASKSCDLAHILDEELDLENNKRVNEIAKRRWMSTYHNILTFALAALGIAAYLLLFFVKVDTPLVFVLCFWIFLISGGLVFYMKFKCYKIQEEQDVTMELKSKSDLSIPILASENPRGNYNAFLSYDDVNDVWIPVTPPKFADPLPP